jgi:hypothetical protein
MLVPGMRAYTTSVDLGRWLDLTGGSWTIDGEPVLGNSLPVPASSASVAQALRRRTGQLAITLPDNCQIPEGALVGAQQIELAAHWIDSHRVFQLAWVDDAGIVTDAWLLAEHDQLAQSGDGEITAARIVAGDRSWTTPQIKKR